MMMFPLVIEFIRKLKMLEIKNLSKQFIKMTLICFILEAFIRYFWSFLIPLSDGIYRFKFHSILFQDTNFLGLVLLVIIFFVRFYEIYFKDSDFRRYRTIAIILLFLSISRAAILAWIIGEFLLYNTNSINFYKKYFRRFILLVGFGMIIGATAFVVLQEDPSFRSKLYILELIEDNFATYRINVLTGVGIGNAELILGIFPHNSILLYFLETGFLGLLFKGTFLLYALWRTRWYGIMVFIPYLIATMSATGYATHYLYVALALMALMTSKNAEAGYKMLN